jgi:hypothetical protein
LADSPPAVAAQGNADTAASGGLRQQAPSRAIAAAKVARPSADTASFSALDRWTSFNFTRAGLGGRHARGDIEGLAALVNTVARSATAADAPLGAAARRHCIGRNAARADARRVARIADALAAAAAATARRRALRRS